MPESSPAIVVDNLSKAYNQVAALDGVSFEVSRGSFFGLLGANGAGKTTLISILGNLVLPNGGMASVLGHDVVRQSLFVRANLGIVLQELTYDSFLTVKESLMFQSSYYGIFDNHDWVATLLDRLSLTDKAQVNTRRLSGGMKRRLMIAQALVHKPAVLILDEPTAGVDINLRLSLWDFVRELNQRGTTIILTTHYLEEAESLCDELALMSHGKVVKQGKTKDLLSLSTRYVAQLRLRLATNELPQTMVCSRQQGDIFIFDINRYSDIEPLLASCRQAGSEIVDLSIASPKLEDIFIDLIAK